MLTLTLTLVLQSHILSRALITPLAVEDLRSAAVSLFSNILFNDSCQTSYLSIYSTDLRQILGLVELRL